MPDPRAPAPKKSPVSGRLGMLGESWSIPRLGDPGLDGPLGPLTLMMARPASVWLRHAGRCSPGASVDDVNLASVGAPAEGLPRDANHDVIGAIAVEVARSSGWNERTEEQAWSSEGHSRRTLSATSGGDAYSAPSAKCEKVRSAPAPSFRSPLSQSHARDSQSTCPQSTGPQSADPQSTDP